MVVIWADAILATTKCCLNKRLHCKEGNLSTKIGTIVDSNCHSAIYIYTKLSWQNWCYYHILFLNCTRDGTANATTYGTKIGNGTYNTIYVVYTIYSIYATKRALFTTTV